MTDAKTTRAFETTLEIDAPVEAVWKAISDAEELTRWFPLDARVRPGVGGSVWTSWGGEWEGEGRIEIWEPGRRLRTVMSVPPYDADGQPTAGAPLPIALDFHLEGRGGRTILRLVHSGFGTGAEWDDEYEGVRHGWAFELRSLRHYLTRHGGRPRRVARARAVTDLPLPEAWERLVAGALDEGRVDGLAEGDRYRFVAATGDVLSGVVMVAAPPRGFAGTAEAFGDGLFRLETWRAAGRVGTQMWLSTWGVDASRVRAFEDRAQRLIEATFGAASALPPSP